MAVLSFFVVYDRLCSLDFDLLRAQEGFLEASSLLSLGCAMCLMANLHVRSPWWPKLVIQAAL